MKCPHCGYNNLKGVERCGKCKKKLKKDKKSCPRCAFKNDLEDKKCQKCGYSFDKKPNIYLNAFISLIIVVILYSLLILRKESLVIKIEYIFKIVSILTIIYIFVSTIESSNRNKKKLNDGLFISPEAKKIKIISRLMLLILGIMILCISGYLYFKYIR